MKILGKSFLFIAAFILFACGVKQQTTETSNNSAIFGGVKVASSEKLSKHVVALYDGTVGSLCTGSLISNDMILTAAHCVTPGSTNLYIIFSTDAAKRGRLDLNNTVMATSFIRHPNYDDKRKTDSNTYDIALILFKGGPKNGYVPLALTSDMSRIVNKNTELIAAGYGVSRRVLSMIGSSGSGTLRSTTLHYQKPFTDSEFLTHQISKGVCSGDSGGPLMVESNGSYVQVGIASRATNIGIPCILLSIFTRVDVYQDWIFSASKQLRGY